MQTNKNITQVKIKKKYICKKCKRIFKRKTNFDTHIIICEQLHDDKKIKMVFLDEENNIPSHNQMFYLVRNLIEKCNKLETEVESLKKYVNITKKKINALDWLNDNITSSISFTEWINNINIQQDELMNVFKCGYIEGVYQILESRMPLSNTNAHPIKCFNQNSNIFFVYNDNKWTHMSMDEFNKLANTINGKIIKAFYIWKNNNADLIESSDRMYDVYTENMRIVLGENKTNQQIIQKLKTKLYSYLKCDLKNIIKYEFVF